MYDIAWRCRSARLGSAMSVSYSAVGKNPTTKWGHVRATNVSNSVFLNIFGTSASSRLTSFKSQFMISGANTKFNSSGL